MPKDLSRLIAPKSIAILGGNWADTVMDQCQKLGFSGPIYRIHPKRAAAGDQGCYPDLYSLPEAPDAVFLGVNRDLTVSLIKDLKAVNAGGAIGFASGFHELHTEEGNEATSKLLEEAGDFPILGPNCYGMINFLDRAPLWPDEVVPKDLERGVAFIAQSGTISNNVLFANRALPLAYLITLGNQSLIDATDMIHAMLADDRVTAIGLYMESIKDLGAFRDACLAAAKKRIPITLFKAGRSQAAQRTTYSHTGAMGGSDRYMGQFFKDLGVARVETLNELIETLKLLHFTGPLPGNNLVVCGGSGGEMAMCADVAEPINITFPEISQDAGTAMAEILGDRIQMTNPFDFQTYLWHDDAAMHQVFLNLMDSPSDLYMLMNDHPAGDVIDTALFQAISRAFIDAAHKKGKKAISGSSVSESQSDAVRNYASLNGVAPMQGLKETFQAINHAHAIHRAWAAIQAPSVKAPTLKSEIINLNEGDAKRLIEKWGVSIPKAEVVPCDAAWETAESMGYPVVVKAVSDTLLHKSEAGGVALNLQNKTEVNEAANHMASLADKVLVEEMINDAVAELIIGMDYDPQFGPVLIVGAGGILTELLNDSVIILPPSSRDAVEAAINSLNISKILDGYRGKPAGDKEALIDTIMSLLSQLEATAGEIAELDINPLIVREKGKGVVAVDALIRKIDA